jgi:hypothetical protein
MNNNFKIVSALLLAFSVLILASCKKDDMETLSTVSNCDTTNVTFSQTIQPLLNTHCNSCHSGNFPSAGVALDNYQAVKAVASSGVLLGTIRHENGYSPMPKNSTKLNDCDIRKVEIWIQNGSLEN